MYNSKVSLPSSSYYTTYQTSSLVFISLSEERNSSCLLPQVTQVL
jgi:hypothetical protein